mmetsp:Transcript_43242/g.57223  ORF Transcript_43242/g.57223 Transcript_43242/m.57223 type:complete len:86 (+) Transcript_43242:284-541(+)|eukprot:CAMPEP_0185572700 /NCGR_PEP_ID=MMETSP0434-20130131/4581_1 /TAXON_ID=626734 ORGANISM="Favella taraikaensis, Strain Fe Narragansett Bay" /NCGR_SAMPLE_ID=MMETSP0434 /ASSEMBLY_ACC=CAM_ASM_000379 /LENGTH=85 /DNA_ID=CAMNT_0028188669 /DNA_START=183 /DNA_END=440 /DNA_ORIENTATION=+
MINGGASQPPININLDSGSPPPPPPAPVLPTPNVKMQYPVPIPVPMMPQMPMMPMTQPYMGAMAKKMASAAFKGAKNMLKFAQKK